MSEASMVARLRKQAPGRWIKLSDRFQEGIPDLLYFRHGTMGLAEAKQWDDMPVRGRKIGFRPSQPAFMDALVRDGAKVALILGVTRVPEVLVVRGIPGDPLRFTHMSKRPWTWDELLELSGSWAVRPEDIWLTLTR